MNAKRCQNNLEELMQKSLSGDNSSYRKLLEETAKIVRGFISKRISSQIDVEDIVQETLIAIHKARPTYIEGKSYKAWMFAIASYKLKDYLRVYYRRGEREAPMSEFADNIFTDDNVTFIEAINEELYEILKDLSPKQLNMLIKTKIEGYSMKEIADDLKMSESAVKVAIHRIMKFLKEKTNKNQ